MAKLFGTIVIGPFDHPLVEDSPDVEIEGEDPMTIRLSEELTVSGEGVDIRRWVQALAIQIAERSP